MKNEDFRSYLIDDITRLIDSVFSNDIATIEWREVTAINVVSDAYISYRLNKKEHDFLRHYLNVKMIRAHRSGE